ncbi:predicted protein [Plenodomus lingam JN3]|uniref:Predicted protein n=1 Tax=Leptosphaeria maculans (strain JN3 / isolate v23.1.3 / race Av1-4-5-6-7-8) TaxID=985895 RepID=E5ACW9_LEPMJ|nr:predicted protein [Plenodomus lingam JN3]CBY02321.1 predicted protein [Plenodomus lingam JN3]
MPTQPTDVEPGPRPRPKRDEGTFVFLAFFGESGVG